VYFKILYTAVYPPFRAFEPYIAASFQAAAGIVVQAYFSWRRVLFGVFCHTSAENGPHDLKMVQKDASRNSTQSVIKISS
jgi:hypothetical protein